MNLKEAANTRWVVQANLKMKYKFRTRNAWQITEDFQAMHEYKLKP